MGCGSSNLRIVDDVPSNPNLKIIALKDTNKFEILLSDDYPFRPPKNILYNEAFSFTFIYYCFILHIQSLYNIIESLDN